MVKTRQKKSNQETLQPQRDVTAPSEVSLPSLQRESLLPLVDVGSRKFEELCRDIIDVEFDLVVRKSLKRRSGMEQFGVEVEGFVSSGCPEIVVSAKCYKKIDAWEFRLWIEDFTKHLDGHWKGKGVKHFVLAITVEANDDNMNHAARKLVTELEARGIQFHLWDKFKITDLLLRKAHLIDRYFNRAWREALSADVEASTPSISAATNRGLADLGPGLQFIAEQMQGLYLSPLNEAYRKELDSAAADLRRGVRQPMRQWLHDKRANPDIWNGLEPGIKSEGLRAAAMLALGEGDTKQCSELLDEAERLQRPPDRTARTFLINATSGIKAALEELQSPSGRKERELYAALELADGRPNDALETLAPLLGEDVSSEVLRLRAIAKFRLGEKSTALNLAKSAVDKSPTHAMPRFALGALRVGMAIAAGDNFPFVGMPNPISRSMLLFDQSVSQHLSEALREFDRLIESVDGDLRLEAEVWKLAALLLNPSTKSEARDFARSLLARATPEPVVVAWCLHHRLPIKRGRIKKLFGDLLRQGAGDESHVVVLALLSGDEPRRALGVLNKFAPMFPEATNYFTHWREQFGEIDENDGASSAAAYRIAVDKGDPQPLVMFLASNPATPDVLMSAAEFLAARGAYREINAIRDRLLRLGTSRAVQIAAGAALNTDDPGASLDILQDAAEAGLEMKGRFLEMRLEARRALGQHQDLIEDLESLIRENDDWKLREQLILAHLRIGALERVKQEAEKALEAGVLEDRHAIQLAYALRNVAPDVARKMLRKTDWSQLPGEMSGGLLSLSAELGLADLQDDMIRRIVGNPNQSNILKSVDSVEEVLKEIERMSEEYRGQVDAWLNGHIPAAIAMGAHPKDYVKLFMADPRFRTSDIGVPIPMFLSCAGTEVARPKMNVGSKRELRIDLGAMMLGERLGILDLLDDDFVVWIAESLPIALDELSGHFGKVNGKIADTLEAIEKSESAVKVVVAPPENALGVATFSDPEDRQSVEALTEILRRAYQAGHLSPALFSDVVDRLQIGDPKSPISLSFDTIILSRGALADLSVLGVIEQVARTFPIRVLASEMAIFRGHLAEARDGERISEQLNDLRRKVAKKLETGQWRTVVGKGSDRERLADKPAPLRCLSEIFPKETLGETLMWIEDRMLSRVATSNVTTVIPLVKELVRAERLTVKDEIQIRRKLREWGYTFLPISNDEVMDVLEQAALVNGGLAENDDLAILRKWFATDVLMLRYTENNSAVENGQAVGEARRFHELLTLKEDLLDLIWKHPNETEDTRRARSRWIWSNLRIPYLPDPLGVATPEARRILVAVNTAKAMALPLHALLSEKIPSPETLRGYLEWLSDEVIEDLIVGDPTAANDAFDHVAGMLAHILDKELSVTPDVAEGLQRHMKRIVRNYLSLLPDDIAERISSRETSGEALPSGRELSLTLADEITVPIRELEKAIAAAVQNEKMNSAVFAHIDGERRKINVAISRDDEGELTVDLRVQRRTFPLTDATIAVMHPDEKTRHRLMQSLSYRDCLNAPLSPAFVDSVASEHDVDVRVSRYVSEIDQDFRQWLSQLGQKISKRSKVEIEHFDLPAPETLLKFLGLPQGFKGTAAEIVSSGMLVEKVGLTEAVTRLSSLPMRLTHDMAVPYAEQLKSTVTDLAEGDAAFLAFTKILARAQLGLAPQNVSETTVSEWVQQLGVFKQIFRHAVWQTLHSPDWEKLPPELMFCLAWVFADQVTRVVSPIGRQPKDLDRWFATLSKMNLVDYHLIHLLPNWIRHVLLKSTSVRMLACLAAELIALDSEVPSSIRAAIGRSDATTYIPLPEVAAASTPAPPEFWLLADAVPAFVRAGWLKDSDSFARRDAAELLRIILDEDSTADPSLYAAMVAVLVPLDAILDVELLDSLAERVAAWFDNAEIVDLAPSHQAFLQVAAEVHAMRNDIESFKSIIVTLAASFSAKWPHDRVRFDDTEAGRTALQLMNIVYMFGSVGRDRTILERTEEIAAVLRAIVDVWPGVRAAVLTLLDDLGSQLDADTACQSVWPTALEIRAK